VLKTPFLALRFGLLLFLISSLMGCASVRLGARRDGAQTRSLAGASDAVAGDSRFPRVVVYNGNWNPLDVHNIPAEKMTHFIYFGIIVLNGECRSVSDDQAKADRENLVEIQKLKIKNPSLKLMFSIAGHPGEFSKAVETDSARLRFVNSCAVMLKKYDLDGIDIDWEFPSLGDKPFYLSFLRELRAEIGAQHLLTIAVNGDYRHFANYPLLTEMLPLLDWINIMGYDFDGTYGHKGHAVPGSALFAWKPDSDIAPEIEQSAREIYNDNAIVKWSVANGIPKHKLVLGVPLYGHKLTGVAAKNHGLYQSTAGAKSAYIYGNDIDMLLRRGYKGYFDSSTKSVWLYSEKDHVFVSYENAESLKYKCQYILDQKLGGIMIWEYGQDFQHHLMNAVHAGLRPDAK
jgi:chitinase